MTKTRMITNNTQDYQIISKMQDYQLAAVSTMNFKVMISIVIHWNNRINMIDSLSLNI